MNLLLAASNVVRVGFLSLLARAALFTLIAVVAPPLLVVFLWMAEGLPDHGDFAARTVELATGAPMPSPASPISVTGPLVAADPASDPLFFTGGDFVRVERVVEMYAWHELITATEQRHWGGWRTRDEDRTYVLGWTPLPQDSSRFAEPGHHNPPMPLEPARTDAQALTVDGRTLAEPELLLLPPGRRLFVDEVTLLPDAPAHTATPTSLYLGDADPRQPEPGDVRVRFIVLDNHQTVTWFGASGRNNDLRAARLDGMPVQDLLVGSRSQAITNLQHEDLIRTVVIRAAGLLLLWGAFYLFASFPIAVLDIAPPVGTAARVAWAIITLPIAGLVWSVTVGLAIVGHNPWATAAVLGAMLLVIAVLFWLVPWVKRPAQRGA